jgi:hypothetical protein
MHPALLVGVGFLVGAFGSKVVCSKPVRKVAVETTRLGLKAKNCVETTIDGAKAEVDDIVAEAEFLNESEAEVKEAAEGCGCGCSDGAAKEDAEPEVAEEELKAKE